MSKTFPMIQALFGHKGRAIDELLNDFIREDKDRFFANEGHLFEIVACSDGAVSTQVRQAEGSNTRVGVSFFSGRMADFTGIGVPELRVYIPTSFLRSSHRPKYWLYNIRFFIDFNVFPVDDQSIMPFRRGYYGVTKRDVFQRFKEHQRDAENGTGHLLHKAWRGLVNEGFQFYPVIQIASFANTLDEIYDAEEHAVETMSLAPKGLNVIPGGHAGIRKLHELRFLDRTGQVKPSDRDKALTELEKSAGGKKAAHYRSGHFRTLFDCRKVWVSPCWVNASKPLSEAA